MPDQAHLSREALGYELHTNRELGLMLRRQKPLAIFSDVEGTFPEVVLRYLRMFDRHVLAGEFVKAEHRHRFNLRGELRVILMILYALADEAWRIDEMIELHEQPSIRTAEDERRFGTLLGYTDEQNDIWIARHYAKR